MQKDIELDTYIQPFYEYLLRSGRSIATAKSYRSDAHKFAMYLHESSIPYSSISKKTLADYKVFLSHEERSNTVRRIIIGVRQFFRYLRDAHQLPDPAFDEMPIPKRIETLPPDLTGEDIEKFLMQCRPNKDKDFASNDGLDEQHENSDSIISNKAIKQGRDALIICLLCYDGLKATEIINLRRADIFFNDVDSDDNEMPQTQIRINGLRNRIITASKRTSFYLRKYWHILSTEGALKSRDIAQAKTDPLIIGFKGRGSETITKGLSRHGLKFIIYDIGQKSGHKHLNSEQMRHFSIQYLIKKGLSSAEIMQHLGLKRLGNISKHFAKIDSENISTVPEGENSLEQNQEARLIKGASDSDTPAPSPEQEITNE